MTSGGRKALFALVTAVLCVAAIELGLAVLAAVSPQVRLTLLSPWDPRVANPTVPDARLGYRPNPLYPDHDDNGFRNPSVPERARIVVLGDSQTYGTGVRASEAWPRQLEALGEPSVYSMAFGGYGPGHSLLLWDEARALEPEIVIEAHYFGNDLYDSFHLVYHQDQLPELKTREAAELREIEEAEASEPIAERVSRMFSMGDEATAPAEADAPPDEDAGGLRSWLAAHSRIYGLLRRARFELERARGAGDVSVEESWLEAQAFADAHPGHCHAFSQGDARTVFTPAYRLAALDPEDLRIREGHRLSLEAISRMHQRAERDGIRFVVLLIPTKELVFRGRASDFEAADYRALTRAELRLRNETRAWLDARGIAFLDLLGPLEAQLAEGPQPYQVSHDGHPNAVGHRVIAETVRAYLESPAPSLPPTAGP